MLNKYKPAIIIFAVLALMIFGIVDYVKHLIDQPIEGFNKPRELSGNNIVIPKEFEFKGAKIALAWTDDNTGEDLIIQSDKKVYNGFNQVEVYFSITNITRKDQDMDVVVWVGDEKVRVEEMERIKNEGVNEGEQTFVRLHSRLHFAGLNRKDVKGFETGYSVNDEIKSGNTNYYKATIKYPPMSKGEFFIEAFGHSVGTEHALFLQNDRVAYGHLDPWYNSDWSYWKKITINSSQIATTTSNFPVLATSTDSDLKTTTHGGHVGNDNGYDIVFADSDGETLLNFEREKYASTTGEIAYWIKTDISSTTDKVIYMYYGNSSASDLATTTGVWDDNFVMVQHLQETPANGETHYDSTKNSNDGTFTDADGDSNTDATGQIDGADDFEGDSDYVDVDGTNLITSPNAISISLWAKPYSLTVDQRLISRWLSPQQFLLWMDTGGTGDGWAWAICTDEGEVKIGENNVDAATDRMQFVVGTVSSGGNTKIYVDGQETASAAAPGNINTHTGNILIGRLQTNYFNGIIDEVRISNVARTAGWIATEYNNQVAVESFLTIGGEEGLQLSVTTDPKVIITGTETSAFTVQAQNLSGNEMVMGNAVTVNLSSDSSGTHHFTATPGGAHITTVTIPADSSSVNFYYTDYKPGSPTITVSATNFTSDTQQQMVQGVWQDTAYQCRRQITINSSQISTTTSNFPVLATTTLANLKTVTNGGKVQNDNGYDIIFVDDDDSTLLNYEREYYASTTGEIAYWIKTDISSTTDKTIYMYYGKSGASDLATTTGVWDDNFVMVQHLAHDGVATTTYPDFLDSTSNDNDGSSKNMNSDDLVAGQIDGSLDFDGSDDYVDVGDISQNGYTFSLWGYFPNTITSATASTTLLQYGSDSAYANQEYITLGSVSSHATDETLMILDYPGAALWERTYIKDNINAGWQHICFRWGGSNYEIFVEGVSKTVYASSDSAGHVASAVSVNNLQIGGDSDGAYNYFNGTIDEVRISNTARTAGWIATEYNNQVSVGSFLTIGGEECLAGAVERSGGESVKTRIKGGSVFKGGVRF